MRHFVELQLADNVKARQLTADGTWERIVAEPGAPRVVCQEVLLREAYERARGAAERRAAERRAERIEPEADAAPALAPVKEADETAESAYVEVTAGAAEPEPTVPELTPVRGSAPTREAAPAPQPSVPEPRRRGRFSRAASLFGQAFGTLFGGGGE